MVDEFRGLPPKTVPTQPLAKLIANQAQKVPGIQNVGARHVVFWCQALCFCFVLGQIGPNLVPGTLLKRQNALLALTWH